MMKNPAVGDIPRTADHHVFRQTKHTHIKLLRFARVNVEAARKAGGAFQRIALQMPARLADGLGLEVALARVYRRPFAPSRHKAGNWFPRIRFQDRSRI